MDDALSVTLLIESSDPLLGDEVGAEFADGEVSVSRNLIGGVEIAVFFLAVAKPLKDLLKVILDFQAAHASRYTTSRVVIGPESIELTGYGPDDLAQLQELPMFQRTESPPSA